MILPDIFKKADEIHRAKLKDSRIQARIAKLEFLLPHYADQDFTWDAITAKHSVRGFSKKEVARLKHLLQSLYSFSYDEIKTFTACKLEGYYTSNNTWVTNAFNTSTRDKNIDRALLKLRKKGYLHSRYVDNKWIDSIKLGKCGIPILNIDYYPSLDKLAIGKKLLESVVFSSKKGKVIVNDIANPYLYLIIAKKDMLQECRIHAPELTHIHLNNILDSMRMETIQGKVQNVLQNDVYVFFPIEDVSLCRAMYSIAKGDKKVQDIEKYLIDSEDVQQLFTANPRILFADDEKLTIKTRSETSVNLCYSEAEKLRKYSVAILKYIFRFKNDFYSRASDANGIHVQDELLRQAVGTAPPDFMNRCISYLVSLGILYLSQSSDNWIIPLTKIPVANAYINNATIQE